jgi:hypothetical protein
MATGLLGQADVASATYTTIYTVPAGYFTVASINLLNRGNSSARFRIALADNATPTDAEFIEYDVEIAAKGVLERTGIMLNEGKRIVVYSSASSVSAAAFGIETSTT